MSAGTVADFTDRRARRYVRPGTVSAALLVCVAIGCSGGDSGGGTNGGTTNGGTNGVYSGGDQAPMTTGTIAYAHGNELRIIEPDGTGDHLVWRTPESGIPGVTYRVGAPAWRPNGWEIAFSSNHEEAYSVFDRDLYAIRPDGIGLRKLTNAPTREQAATYPKGTVRITIQNENLSEDSFTIIVQGADPSGVVVPPGSQVTLTVSNVADLGTGVQQGIVAAAGTYRWNGPTVDVKAGQTVDAGLMYIHPDSTIEGYGATQPFWRSDSTKVGYSGPYCELMSVASNPPPGFVHQTLVGTNAFLDGCRAYWGPTPATADKVLVSDFADYMDTGYMKILEMTEGTNTKPLPLYSLPDPSIQIPDLHWLPDGSGFVFARAGSDVMQRYDVNLWEYRFATGTAAQVTNAVFDNPYGMMRRFAVSPDGSKVAFEMVHKLYGDSPAIGFCDLWVMNRDGSDQKLLASDAAYPAWNPQR